MKLPLMLFGVLLAMCVIIGIVLTTHEPDNAHGFAHSTFEASMQQGGSGLERHRQIRWLGLAYGTLQIVFFVSCLVLGVRDPQNRKWAFLLAGIVYVATFCLMVVADHYYVHDDNPTLVLGFPLPTAIMLYGLWGVPLIFLLFYIINFDRWILSPVELERFEKLLQEKRKQKEAGG